MYSGVQEVVSSVSDIPRIARVFTRVFGWRAKRLPDAPREQWKAWRVPRGVRRIEQCLLIPARDDKGCVRLVRFHGSKPRVMRSSGRTWDTGGIFDIDVYAHDVRAIYRELQREGWSAYGDPADYSWAGFDVCEVVATGPDGLVIALIEPKHPPRAKFPRYKVSRVFNSACIVRDFAATKRFFEQTLGWKYIVESEVQGVVEPGQLMLGLPLPLARDTVRRIGIVHPTGENDGSIEPVSMPDVGGRDFAGDCVAPNLGWLSWRYPVTDARATAARLVARGATLFAPPSTLRIAPYGDVISFSVRTPDGALLEFYEPAAPASRARRSPSS